MVLPDEIQTERMTLRRATTADAPAVFERYAQDRDVTRFMAWRPHKSIADTEAFLSSQEKAWSTGEGHRCWALVPHGEQAAIGMIGASTSISGTELGYVLAQAYWGKGLMPEAVAALTETLFQLGVWRVAACCHVDNLPSRRVMEKCGMVHEGTARRYLLHPNVDPDVPADCHVFAIVRPTENDR